MDLIELRTIATVVSFVVFLGILWWAYGGSQSKHFAEAARIPFDEDQPGATQALAMRTAARSAAQGKEAGQ